ncbi:ATP-grasp domain-containing protein [Clostridium sp. AM58-1XD]|uniref:ATP-grasp domain-containing protein n=1 Tax=Clostridium sp. AM58-1XD TaxID=2292307 RepID=UPI000E4CE315|nr:ATP-grasp domain-containing protein [Clostridium sp. AM58-1XD]RGY98931.1 ATP-grasp domain-containing protein [Clostridium sp. AM58-1XD]
MERALVTAIGSFAADIVIRNLKETGFYVVGCDIYDEKWVAESLETDEFFRAPYASDETAYIRFLIKLCSEKNISFLIPLTDAEVDVLNRYRKAFEEIHTVLCLSPEQTISLCRDKLRLEEYIRKAGLCSTIPSKKLIKAVEQYKTAESFPWNQVVLKPFNGRSSSGLYRVYDKEKLPSYLGLIDNPKEYVIQPLIEGTVITVDIVRDAMGNTAAVPRRELLRTLNGAGTSVEVFRDEDLEETCGKIAGILDIRGCVNFEFIEEKGTGKRYFMECNPRFSGGAAFSCEAGYDMVANHIRVFQGGEIEKENRSVPRYIARKYQEYRMN